MIVDSVIPEEGVKTTRGDSVELDIGIVKNSEELGSWFEEGVSVEIPDLIGVRYLSRNGSVAEDESNIWSVWNDCFQAGGVGEVICQWDDGGGV